MFWSVGFISLIILGIVLTQVRSHLSDLDYVISSRPEGLQLLRVVSWVRYFDVCSSEGTHL
jgi:hypothetical protein